MSGKRISDMTDDEIFAATVFMETRSREREDHVWVAWVIKNRKNNPSRFGSNSYSGICLAPSQFECWAPGKSNCLEGDRFVVKRGEEDIFNLSQDVVREVKKSQYDPTNGADHYHKTTVPHDWAPKMTSKKEKGGHSFYKE